MSRKTRGKTKFQKIWTDEFPWVEPHTKNDFIVKCKLCRCEISVENMGKSALKSHSTGVKHKKNELAVETTVPLEYHKPQIALNLTSEVPNVGPNVANETSNFKNDNEKINPEVPAVVRMPSANQRNKTLQAFLQKEQVFKAEILWCIKSVITHRSLRNTESDIDVMLRMFPDNQIAKEMKLGKTKISYSITYGLGPYVCNELQKNINNCDFFVVGFDESLNKIAQSQQMDVTIRYWDPTDDKVKTSYWTSVFLKRERAEDLLDALKKALQNLDINKVLQISMDGPHVNFKMLKLLKDELRSEASDPQLLEMGSCGVHTVHCAFKAGMKATGWSLEDFFRALYNFFKDLPSRRGDFTACTGCTQFPLKFCSIRWLENASVARRCLSILPAIKTYVQTVRERPKSQQPKCDSFVIIEKMTKDNLIAAKVAFFETMAKDVEPFLNEFQGDEPLVPFLYTSLTEIIYNAMARFIKKDVLDSKTSLKNIDVDANDNLVNSRDVDVGYRTRNEIAKGKGFSKKDILLFNENCKKGLQAFLKKILERSPIKYPLVRAVACLDPQMITAKIGSTHLLKKCLDILVSQNLLEAGEAEVVDREYKHFITSETVKKEMCDYRRSDVRLDDFWMKLLGHSNDFVRLKKFIKMIHILSHGNASVERGFSVNKECLVENQKEASLIAQRHIYDYVSQVGGITKINVSKQMIQDYKNSHGRYKDALQQRKKIDEEQKKENEKKKEIEREVKELEKQKLLLEEHRSTIAEEIEKKKKELTK